VPGTIGLTQISGRVGSAIQVGEWLNGEGFHVWEHAFVALPGNKVLEAEPGGAVIVDMHYTHVYWCDAIYNASPGIKNASPVLLAQTAEHLKGVPYSFADYAALAAHRLHIPAPGLRDFIADNGHMICSQLADEFYLRLGAHIFTDDRWAGDVTPASLFNRNEQLSH
jgi:hypothetical protein